jgi:hypothetical protein
MIDPSHVNFEYEDNEDEDEDIDEEEVDDEYKEGGEKEKSSTLHKRTSARSDGPPFEHNSDKTIATAKMN